MTAALRNRVRKLEGWHPFAPDDCAGGTTVIVGIGEPAPTAPQRCRLCGRVHLLELVEEIVTDRPRPADASGCDY